MKITIEVSMPDDKLRLDHGLVVGEDVVEEVSVELLDSSVRQPLKCNMELGRSVFWCSQTCVA
jgi:hypothetical protein